MGRCHKLWEPYLHCLCCTPRFLQERLNIFGKAHFSLCIGIRNLDHLVIFVVPKGLAHSTYYWFFITSAHLTDKNQWLLFPSCSSPVHSGQPWQSKCILKQVSKVTCTGSPGMWRTKMMVTLGCSNGDLASTSHTWSFIEFSQQFFLFRLFCSRRLRRPQDVFSQEHISR